MLRDVADDNADNILKKWPCNRNRLIGGTDSIYFWPIFQALISGNIPTRYGLIWY